jgi:uncharacterized protein (TIGR02594 family)
MNFIMWLQSRLIAHGYPVGRAGADGDLGGDTIKAIFAFQRGNGLAETGVADAPTVAALRAARSPAPGSAVPPSAPPDETMPPWMAEMARRHGLHERTHNKSLSDWLKIGKWLGDPAKLPWCGDAVETCIVKTLPQEPVPGNPFFAQNWKAFGINPGGPIVGAIGVIRWSASAGHVGLVADYDARRKKVTMLGGNQSDSIRLSAFDLDSFIAFRWPRSFPVKRYPRYRGAVDAGGGVAATR